MITELRKEHIPKIEAEFLKQGWDSRKEVLLRYLSEQKEKKRIVLVATKAEECRGYVTLDLYSENDPFKDRGIPEITDFNVFEAYQKQGIGRELMTFVLKKASEFSDKVGIGVGLNRNYGPAQRMYAKYGFIPDGTGVWYQGKPLPVNGNCLNDNDLVLYFEKKF